jgi:lysophospholipase L1-like esterase
VRRELPRTPVAFIAVKPSLARWAMVEKVRETNRLVQRLAESDSLVRYLDVFTPMLDASGRPRPELFQPDGLHLTPAGYLVWREVVAPALR